MARHETGSDNRLAITNCGIDRGRGKDPLLKETLGKGKCLRLASDEDRNNRRLGCADLEADRLEPLVHLARIAPEQFDPLGLGTHDFKRLENSPDDGGCQRCCENKAAGLVPEKFDHLV